MTTVLACEGETGPCGKTVGVRREPARTAYDVGGFDCGHEDCATDPKMKELCFIDRDARANHSPLLCRECAVEYHAHWDEMWATYYGSLL